MSEAKSIRSCSVANDGSQEIRYENILFPAYIQKIKYPEDGRFSVIDHWHDEIEFIYCISGSVSYCVEGTTLILEEGSGIFVNSRKLHVVSHQQSSPSEFYCVILHPLLLSSSKFVDEKYIEPIIHNQNLPYIKLHSDVLWEGSILRLLEGMYNSLSDTAPALTIQKNFFEIWQLLFTNLELSLTGRERPNHNLSILKNMLSYIHQHYPEKISLEDICVAGNVGKTMCIAIFNSYVNKTPGEFIREFRIQKSIELLAESDMSVTEISYETGFSDASYYTKVFRESMGMTPLEYRKRHSA